MLGRVLILLVLFSSTVFAQDKTKAREAYRTGTQHYDLGEYAEALESFKAAYRVYEDPSFLFNIAQCHRLLGNKDQAIKSYQTYLMKVPTAPNRDAVREMIARLERMVADERAAASSPPQGTLTPRSELHSAESEARTVPAGIQSTPTTQGSPSVLSSGSENTSLAVAKAPSRSQPLYKKWWLWSAVGGVAVGVAVGVGLGVTLSRSASASTDLGTSRPSF